MRGNTHKHRERNGNVTRNERQIWEVSTCMKRLASAHIYVKLLAEPPHIFRTYLEAPSSDRGKPPVVTSTTSLIGASAHNAANANTNVMVSNIDKHSVSVQRSRISNRSYIMCVLLYAVLLAHFNMCCTGSSN